MVLPGGADEIDRVMIGRIEMVTPEQRAKLKQLAVPGDPDSGVAMPIT